MWKLFYQNRQHKGRLLLQCMFQTGMEIKLGMLPDDTRQQSLFAIYKNNTLQSVFEQDELVNLKVVSRLSS